MHYRRSTLFAIMAIMVACNPAEATGPPVAPDATPYDVADAFQPPVAGVYAIADYYLEIVSSDGARREVFAFDAGLVNDVRFRLDASELYSGNLTAVAGNGTWVRRQVYDNGVMILDEPFQILSVRNEITSYTLSECRSTCPDILAMNFRKPTSASGWRALLSTYEFTSWRGGSLTGVHSSSQLVLRIV